MSNCWIGTVSMQCYQGAAETAHAAAQIPLKRYPRIKHGRVCEQPLKTIHVGQSNPTCIYIYPNNDATSFEKFVSVCYGQSPLLKPCIAITVFIACLYQCYSVFTVFHSSNVCMYSTFAQGYKPFRESWHISS